MRVLLSSDPHIGFVPKSNVTTESARHWAQAVYAQALAVTSKELATELEVDYHICCGDFFDKYTNRENVLADGARLLPRFDVIMSGNHDVRNVTKDPFGNEPIGSLRLLSELPLSGERSTHVLFTETGETPRFYFGEDGCTWYFLCHYLTQEDFEAALRTACEEHAESSKDNDHRGYLFLHCNVGDGYGKTAEAHDSTLTLTPELQALAEEHFDLIFVGHEHKPRRQGKVVVLGNTFPLSFGEICERFVYVLDTVTGELEQHSMLQPVYQKVPAGSLCAEGAWYDGLQFLDITGEVKVEDVPALNRLIAQVWKTGPSTLLGIRNNTEVIGQKKVSQLKATNIVDMIRELAEKAGFEDELAEVQS